MTTLEMRNGIKFYVSGREITKALRDINLSMTTGEFIAVTGESGSGKSTLAHILAGVFTADKGTLYLDGESTSHYGEEEWEAYRRDTISFIAQNYGILPGNTVWDNVISALALAGLGKEEAAERAEKLLRQVDLWELRGRRAAKLSSGQKQRLSIARAVAKPAPVLIADEPTSNLDTENAEHIVTLFEEEARHRLVVMVTHNYDAVKATVTRHIEIQNGEVVTDEVLRDKLTKEVTAEAAKAPAKKQTKNSLGRPIAMLLLKARPVWTMLMLFFFTLTAFAVFAFMGTFITALDDTGTKYYNNAAFLNGNDRRLVVLREDGQGFTEEEYETLAALDYVDSLERYGVLADINYYYRKNVDYVTRIMQDGGGTNSDSVFSEGIVLRNHTVFAQTIPVVKEEVQFLTAGRLPEHFSEVVAVGESELLGDKIMVYVRDGRNWGADTYIAQEMTVVGITDKGSGLYFDDRLGVMLWQNYYCKATSGLYFYGIDTSMTGNRYTMPEKAAPAVLREIKQGIMKVYNLETGTPAEAELAGKVDSNHPYLLGFSEEFFDEISSKTACNQVAVYLLDYAYTDRAIEEIEALGYRVLSPYQMGTVVQNEQRENERMTTLIVCLGALLVVLLAQAVVLGAMFGAETGSYTQLRNLGLTYRDGKASVRRQVMLLTIAGQLIGGVLVYTASVHGVAAFVNLTKYLLWWHVIVLSAVHAAASVLVVIVVSAGLKKKVFPFLPGNYDVDLGELDAGKGCEK